ncbi:putative caffeine resistance protein [Meredithblackwellia eburnea MCA 4105]
MTWDIIRDSTVGQLINSVSAGRFLPYPDQQKDYVVPERYLLSVSKVVDDAATLNEAVPSTKPSSDANTLVNAEGVIKPTDVDVEKAVAQAPLTVAPTAEYQYLVTWDGPEDPANPRNWSRSKRIFVAFLISFLTFSVYIGSAIYTPSIPGLMEEFGVGLTSSTWGLTLFVLAYGIGPMFLAPLQEMPRFGRTPVYIIGLFLFTVLQLPAIFAKNMSTVLAMRFLTGFFGSPALATGGASMVDIFSLQALPVAIGTWSMGAVSGPVLGPVIGGFAAQHKGWRWTFLELIWISAFALVVLALFLPETMGETILLRKAQRLRKLTGNPLLKTEAELARPDGESVVSVAWENFVMALRLSLEPALLFSHVYIGIVYSIFYLWFEAFPLVFTDIYHFNLGVSGLPFLGFVVSGVITFTLYVLYQKYHVNMRYARNPNTPPEIRLELALFASFFPPISVLLFGWSAQYHTHWIVPIIGAALYLPGIFLLFQCILLYVSSGYPKHAASIFAGNDLFRSTLASFFPLFGRALFVRLGLGGGSSLLAGLSVLMIPLLYLLFRYGAALRQRSKFTEA